MTMAEARETLVAGVGPIPTGAPMAEWRCGRCDALLGRHLLAAPSVVTVKCLRCKTLNTVRAC